MSKPSNLGTKYLKYRPVTILSSLDYYVVLAGIDVRVTVESREIEKLIRKNIKNIKKLIKKTVLKTSVF